MSLGLAFLILIGASMLASFSIALSTGRKNGVSLTTEYLQGVIYPVFITPLKRCFRVSLVIGIGLHMGIILFSLSPSVPGYDGIAMLFPVGGTPANISEILYPMAQLQILMFGVTYVAHIIIWALIEVFTSFIDVISLISQKTVNPVKKH